MATPDNTTPKPSRFPTIPLPQIFTSLMNSPKKETSLTEPNPSQQISPIKPQNPKAPRTHVNNKHPQLPTYTNQSDFNKALIKAYSAAKPNDSGYLWCPIFKQYLPPCLVDITHIIPAHTNATAVGYLFGHEWDGKNHINSLSNGMILAKCISRVLSNGDFAIIPVIDSINNPASNPLIKGFNQPTMIKIGSPAWTYLNSDEQAAILDIQEFKASINPSTTIAQQPKFNSDPDSPVDRDGSIRELEYHNRNPSVKLKLILMKPYHANKRLEDMDIYHSDLHNIILEFKSEFRPDLRYLYYRYVMSMLIWLNIEEARLYKDAWRVKEGWLRESVIVEIARPERMANWEVYEEILAGRGMFDEERGSDEEGWVLEPEVEVDEKGRLRRAATGLLGGLLINQHVVL
ncbi:hypothetical protein TWF694_000747 [Orbilia ellipsospora]|uniref:HNH nuclease domain-containing protein n=1 Tax=Orbilia ellipsospora TaxID=2528407 RepID=A0AAV9XPW4_9PEZI